MVLYSKSEVRRLLSKDLHRRKFDRWLEMIQRLTPYPLELGIPTHPKVFKNGKPQKVMVFDEMDLEKLESLYDRVVYEHESLTYAINEIFLNEKDFARWLKGDYDIEEERKNIYFKKVRYFF